MSRRKTNWIGCSGFCGQEYNLKKHNIPADSKNWMCPECQEKQKKEDEEYKAILDPLVGSPEKYQIDAIYKIIPNYPQEPARPFLKSNPTAQDAREFASAMEDYEKSFSEYNKKLEELQKSKEKAWKYFKRLVIGICLPIDMPEWQKNKVYEYAYEETEGGKFYNRNDIENDLNCFEVMFQFVKRMSILFKK